MNRNSFTKMATLRVLANKTMALESSETDLQVMTKAKLVEFGNSIGLHLDSKLKKDALIESIKSSSEFADFEEERRIDAI